ncbi:MAG: hypothetical protein D6681_19160, partial [Calditrichaeota bacterium]
MKKFPSGAADLLADESFQRWITGTASAEEAERWQDWLQSHPEHQALYEEALKLWQIPRFRSFPVPSVEAQIHRLRERLHSQTVPPAPEENASGEYGSSPNIRVFPASPRTYAAIAAVAAAVLLLLLFGKRLIFTDAPAYSVLTTAYGERQKLTFPDGSVIILNANSTLEYPRTWTDHTRRHFRLQGEAFFKVASLPEGTQRDFVVETADGFIRVVGTAFTVHARKGTRVALREGTVDVVVRGDDPEISSIPRIRLTPGEFLSFRKGDPSVQPSSRPLDVYFSWWERSLRLNRTPFHEIARRLEE